MRKVRIATLVLAAGVVVAAAFAAQSRDLFVNGQKAGDPAIVHEGKTYVSVASLKAAGAEVTEAEGRVTIQFVPVRGRQQADAVEGVIGEWVNNGAWRIRVVAVRPARNPFFGREGGGAEVDIEYRNALSSTKSLFNTGAQWPKLFTTDGRTMDLASSAFNAYYQTLPPGGAGKATLRFGFREPNQTGGTPDKLFWEFRTTGMGQGVPFNTRTPSMRISLLPGSASQ
ncbi:MAG: hypothetical protein SNJ74_03765 [Fimbriimonadaceae bacterium]